MGEVVNFAPCFVSYSHWWCSLSAKGNVSSQIYCRFPVQSLFLPAQGWESWRHAYFFHFPLSHVEKKSRSVFCHFCDNGQYLDNEFGGANPRIDIVGANQKCHLITHADHFYVLELCNLRKGFASMPENWPVFHVFGSEDIKTAGVEAFKITPEHLRQTPF